MLEAAASSEALIYRRHSHCTLPIDPSKGIVLSGPVTLRKGNKWDDKYITIRTDGWLEYTDLYHTSRSRRYSIDLKEYIIGAVKDNRKWVGGRDYRFTLNRITSPRTPKLPTEEQQNPTVSFDVYGDEARRGSDDASNSTVDTASNYEGEKKESLKMRLKRANEDIREIIGHNIGEQSIPVEWISFKFVRRLEAERWHRGMLKAVELAMHPERVAHHGIIKIAQNASVIDDGSEDDSEEKDERSTSLPYWKRLLPSVVVAQLSYFLSRSSYVLLAIPLNGADPASRMLATGASFGLAFMKLSVLSIFFGALVIVMAVLLDMAMESGRSHRNRSLSSMTEASSLAVSPTGRSEDIAIGGLGGVDEEDLSMASSVRTPSTPDTLPIVPMKELIDQLIDEVLPTIPHREHVNTSFPHALPSGYHHRRQVGISDKIFTRGINWTVENETTTPDCKVYSTFDLFPDDQWPAFSLTCRGLNAKPEDMVRALSEFDRYERCDETMDKQKVVAEDSGCMLKHSTNKSIWPVSTRDYMIMFAIVPLANDGTTAMLSRSARLGEVPDRLGGDAVVMREDSGSIRGLLDYSCWFIRPSVEGKDKTDLIFLMHGDLKGNLGMVGKISGIVSRRQLVRICAAAEKEANNEDYH